MNLRLASRLSWISFTALALTACNSNGQRELAGPPATIDHPERSGIYLCEDIDPGIFRGPGCDRTHFLRIERIDADGHVHDTRLQAGEDQPVEETDAGTLVTTENEIVRDDQTTYRFDPSGETVVTSRLIEGGEASARLVIHYRKIGEDDYAALRKAFDDAEAIRRATLRAFTDAIVGQTFRLTAVEFSALAADGTPTGTPTVLDVANLAHPNLFTHEIRFVDGAAAIVDGSVPTSYGVHPAISDGKVFILGDHYRLFGYASLAADGKSFVVLGAEPDFTGAPDGQWAFETYTLVP